MRPVNLVSLGALSFYVLPLLVASSGCGGDSGTNAPLDEATKKADQGVQDGMKAFMQQKTQPKSKSK